ncbi:HsdM family class I SAM-dependent methyltransferase [Neptuniibacter marinus]|uniref:HsdM family class I SAM-dependent methyltransferase n=1 Tax=Neptuniibacter marinus TaxID=1806670 RepID=UPI0008322C56|nr:N-6 DNA methylase [Neptuniibacter marinus]
MISARWLKTLRLEDRKSPEFIRSGDNLSGIPHSSVIRKAFEELNIAAIHCISGVPSIAILVQDELNQPEIDAVHKALWNQGLATILLVISRDTLRVYSLAQLPETASHQSDKLVKVFGLIDDALELKDFILGVESGRFIASNEEKFDSKHRVDQVLLSNLEVTVKRLIDNGISLESAQALLMQVMFIAYLEDKEIITDDYFQTATNSPHIKSLRTLLNEGDVSDFNQLFNLLKHHFNGDLFVAPCSFDENDRVEHISTKHVKILSDFRAGNISISSGQLQFWPYDFKFIPIDLISAVYDRFLGFNPTSKRASGAYYTPMFLADLVTEQAWEQLSKKQKAKGNYVDPSCGSGIFLVRLLEKMIDDWRINHRSDRPTWPALLSMLNRLHGFDIKKESIRVASFSLYIALLENTRPTEILSLMEKGRLLPKLFGKTLRSVDFFEVPKGTEQYDLIIGNPPWVSRRGEQVNAEKWCKDNQCGMPAREVAWGFAWKTIQHTNQEGVIALLLKATSFLTNHSNTVTKARREWLNNIHLLRVINFADMRFQLFDGGDAPTALMIFKPKNKISDYKFEYWTPKADLNLKTKRMITLSRNDQAKLSINQVIEDQLLMKRRMWMTTPEAKLFQYLNRLPSLTNRLITYQESKKKVNAGHGKWIIGQGFIPAQEHKLEDISYKTAKSSIVTKVPHLETKRFQPLVLPEIESGSWSTDIVYRKGYEEGFKAPHVLIPQGVESTQGRLRASFSNQDLSFRDSIQAIHFEKEDTQNAKFLTVLLNSSLTAWFLFHHSSNTGMERDKVHQEQLLDIPFPSIEELADSFAAEQAFNMANDFMDMLLCQKDDLLRSDITSYRNDIDQIIYKYFGLSEVEVSLIEETLSQIIPSMQPNARSKTLPKLWTDTYIEDWQSYSESLSIALSKWLEKPYQARAELVGYSADLVILGVNITEDQSKKIFTTRNNGELDTILQSIWKSLPEGISSNFQLIPDLRVFIDDVLYMVKPRKKRFWLKSTAMADADTIASDLFSLAD